jgi:acyl carrier protein
MLESSIQNPEEAALAKLIISTLNLEISESEIGPNEALFGDGLGLDSIDILEISLMISQTYGVQLRSDDENNHKVFQSLRSLSSYIQSHRLK